jgi:hypothetical protein
LQSGSSGGVLIRLPLALFLSSCDRLSGIAVNHNPFGVGRSIPHNFHSLFGNLSCRWPMDGRADFLHSSHFSLHQLGCRNQRAALSNQRRRCSFPASSLRLGSRIVPWTPSSLGKNWPLLRFMSRVTQSPARRAPFPTILHASPSSRRGCPRRACSTRQANRGARRSHASAICQDRTCRCMLCEKIALGFSPRSVQHPLQHDDGHAKPQRPNEAGKAARAQ